MSETVQQTLRILVLTWLIAFAPAMLRAQAPSGAAPRSAAGSPTNDEPIREAKPDLFYLKDKDGNLQPVLGFTLEDFQRLLSGRESRDTSTTPASYRIDTLAVEGKAAGDRADLTLTLSIDIDVPRAQWVRVPIRLGELVLRGEVGYHGKGRAVVEFSEAANEYVAWIHADGQDAHQIVLRGVATVTESLGQTRLRLSAPRARTSELTFEVPRTDLSGLVSPGAVLDATERLEGDRGTRFRVLGLGGDFTLAWSQSGLPGVELPPVLEATGGLVVRVDGRSAQTQAQLSIRSFGGPFDTFRVRLPPGAVLLANDQPDYTITLLDSSTRNQPKPSAAQRPAGNKNPAPAPAQPAAATAGALVEVRLRQPTIGPASIRLSTTQSYAPPAAQPAKPAKGNNAGDWLELAGFEVQGAVRQWGHVVVQVVDEWQLIWGPRRQVRQVEEVPAELWRESMMGGFEYSSQPFSLPVRVIPRTTRVTVEPDYIVSVGAKRVDLAARWKFHVSGAKLFSLAVDLPGWQIDEVGPASIVGAERLVVDRVEPLELPLLRPVVGDVTIQVRAHRIAEQENRVDFTLPTPRADASNAASVTIVPAEHVHLQPDPAAISGMTQHRRSNGTLDAFEHRSLSYLTTAPGARFVAERRLFQREVRTDTHARLAMHSDRVDVDQRFEYTVSHEPLDSLSMVVAARVLSEGRLTLSLDGDPLAWTAPSDEVNEPNSPVTVQVRLPAPRTGLFTVRAGYSLAEESLPADASVPRSVPLLQPADAEAGRIEVDVVSDPAVRVQVRDPDWQLASESATDGALRWTTTAPHQQLDVILRLARSAPTTRIVVDRLWLQTWLGPRWRQDRAVYRLGVHGGRFTLRLPTGVAASEVLVDGRRTSAIEGSTPEQLVIPLGTDGATTDPVTVDVRYRFADSKPRAWQQHEQLHQPRLVGDVWVRQAYWQVLLPRDEQIWSVAAPYAQETEWDRWSWLGFDTPSMSQLDLEHWTDAVAETDLGQAMTPSLFSSSDPQADLEIGIARRSLVVLAGSGLALLIGLGLMYWPPLRHPAALLVGGMVVVAFAAVNQSAAWLLAQAGVLGVALSAVSLLLRRIVQPRRMYRTPYRPGASSIVERESTRTFPHVAAPAGSAPAPALPVQPGSAITATVQQPPLVGESGPQS